MKKICVATGSRAEYGLLRPLLIEIAKQKDSWQLQLLVTGMHLSPEFGLTAKEIKNDGFVIDKEVEMLLSSDTPSGIIKSIGVGLIGISDAIKELKPDLIIILGDRFEMLAVAEAALIFKIPIAHIHGGEITEGAYDNAIRHAITKMSHLHFASTEIYRKRIIQMGEQPEHVYNTGAIGLDSVRNLKLLSKQELENLLKIKFKKNNYLITFHPATLNENDASFEFKQLIAAIEDEKDSFFIFTKANADNGGRSINNLIDAFSDMHSNNCVAFTSMGQLRYLSTMQYVDAVIGNSSSGIIEAPSFKIATINIGDRQKGRIQANSVIDCVAEKESIKNALRFIKSDKFKERLMLIENPYGTGNSATNIVEILKQFQWNNLVSKKFYDLN